MVSNSHVKIYDPKMNDNPEDTKKETFSKKIKRLRKENENILLILLRINLLVVIIDEIH